MEYGRGWGSLLQNEHQCRSGHDERQTCLFYSGTQRRGPSARALRAALGDGDRAGLQGYFGNRRDVTNKLVGVIRNEDNVVGRVAKDRPPRTGGYVLKRRQSMPYFRTL